MSNINNNSNDNTATASAMRMDLSDRFTLQETIKHVPDMGARLIMARFLASLLDEAFATDNCDYNMRTHGLPHFPLFASAYKQVERAETMSALREGRKCRVIANLSQDHRLALKNALRADVDVEMARHRAQATLPKTFEGEALPADPAQCLCGVDALLVDAEAELTKLQSRIARMREAKALLQEFKHNVEAADKASSDETVRLFARMPSPHNFEECVGAKRARLE